MKKSWSKLSGTEFLTEKLVIVKKWQPCRLFDMIIWHYWPQEWVAVWLSRAWSTVQAWFSLCYTGKWICWRSNVSALISTVKVNGHRNVFDGTTSFQKYSIELVKNIHWYSRFKIKTILITFFDVESDASQICSTKVSVSTEMFCITLKI